jgi:hypothetical protein
MRTTFPGPGARFGTKRPRLTLATTLCQPFAATFVTAARLPDWAPGRSPGCGLRPGRAELPGPRRRNSTPAACRWNRCAPPPETPGGSHQHPGCAQNSGTAHRGSGKRHSSSALSKDSACELLNALLARRASEAQGCLLRRQEICFRRIGPPWSGLSCSLILSGCCFLILPRDLTGRGSLVAIWYGGGIRLVLAGVGDPLSISVLPQPADQH